MNRRLLTSMAVVLGLALLIGAGVYGYRLLRRVDGRTAAGWLAFAERASRTVAYHAEGVVLTNGTRARYTLEQSTGGCFTMTTRDAGGRRSTFGYDGGKLWYATGTKSASINSSSSGSVPATTRGRILGTAVVASRPAVRLAVASGPVEKVLTLDRRTGVVLGMTTSIHHRVLSKTQVDSIDYRDVPVTKCAVCCPPTTHTASLPEITRALGAPVVQPGWLPPGFALSSTLLGKCDMCKHDMATLRYTDGISAITIFEMPASCGCSMGEGCYQAPAGSAIVENKVVGKMSVTIVGSVEEGTLKRILVGLR